MWREKGLVDKPTLEDFEGEIHAAFIEIADSYGEDAACRLFKKFSKPASPKRYRDAELLWLYYTMENPKKRTLAKQIDPENYEKVEARPKRALKDKRYARLRRAVQELADDQFGQAPLTFVELRALFSHALNEAQ